VDRGADDGEDALWNILYRRWTAFDIRRVPDTGPQRRQVWLRTSAPLPDDPHLHTAVLAYVSIRRIKLDRAIAMGGTDQHEGGEPPPDERG